MTGVAGRVEHVPMEEPAIRKGNVSALLNACPSLKSYFPIAW